MLNFLVQAKTGTTCAHRTLTDSISMAFFKRLPSFKEKKNVLCQRIDIITDNPATF